MLRESILGILEALSGKGKAPEDAFCRHASKSTRVKKTVRRAAKKLR
jgi:hypothetical protein